MRSSALAGFLASAVFVSGSAGFASTFLVGPYLGEHVRHASPRAGLMSSAAPIDPLAALQVPATATVKAASLEGEPPASQTAHRLRKVENTTPAPATTTSTTPAATVTPAAATTTGADMPGPITEEAFAPTAPSTLPVSSGGPLIATETTSAMVSSRLEDGEPVLTLRIAPVVAASAPAVDTTDPDNAVEPTVISAPPSEQALATSTVATAPVPATEPVAPPPPAEPVVRPRTKPALQTPEPAPVEPQRRVKPHGTAPAARVTTTAAPAPSPVEEPIAPPLPDPLNAPYIPSGSPTLGGDEPTTAPATGAPAPMAPPPAQPASTGGPTPLVMPQ